MTNSVNKISWIYAGRFPRENNVTRIIGVLQYSKVIAKVKVDNIYPCGGIKYNKQCLISQLVMFYCKLVTNFSYFRSKMKIHVVQDTGAIF